MPRINGEMLLVATALLSGIIAVPIGLFAILLYATLNIDPALLFYGFICSSLAFGFTSAYRMVTVNFRPPPSLGIGKCDGCSKTAKLHKAKNGNSTLKLCETCLYK